MVVVAAVVGGDVVALTVSLGDAALVGVPWFEWPQPASSRQNAAPTEAMRTEETGVRAL